MAGSQQYTVGTTATVIASAPESAAPGPTGWLYVANGATEIYVGGANVSSTTGAAVAASGTFSGYLFPGDVIYAVTATGTSTVSVLQTGS